MSLSWDFLRYMYNFGGTYILAPFPLFDHWSLVVRSSEHAETEDGVPRHMGLKQSQGKTPVFQQISPMQNYQCIDLERTVVSLFF